MADGDVGGTETFGHQKKLVTAIRVVTWWNVLPAPHNVALRYTPAATTPICSGWPQPSIPLM